MDECLAALDIGTNTVLLLLARSRPDGVIAEVQDFCRTTRLGEDTGRTGRLSPAAMERTLATVAEFFGRLSGIGGRGRGIAAATSAARDAANGAEFLERCAACIGGRPHLLSGEQEARTVFRGAASDQAAGQFVITIDIGGGSTEIAGGFADRCLYSTSLNLGCVRFGERFGLYEVPDAAAVAAARAATVALLAPVCAQVKAVVPAGTPWKVIASGGTATTYAAMHLGLVRYDARAVHGYVGSRAGLVQDLARLWSLPSAKRAELPGVTAGRAPVLPTGVMILEEALGLLGAAAVFVTTRGLRYGLALRLRDGELAPTWTW